MREYRGEVIRSMADGLYSQARETQIVGPLVGLVAGAGAGIGLAPVLRLLARCWPWFLAVDPAVAALVGAVAFAW